MSPLQFFVTLCILHQIHRVLVVLSGCFRLNSIHTPHLSLKLKPDALGIFTLLFHFELLLAYLSVIVAMLL